MIEHKNCTGCGSCCGPVPVSKSEVEKIKRFVSKMDIMTYTRLKNQKKDFLTCQFRDLDKNNCAIYPVRPLICKLFGVVKGMHCVNGNTAEIDGYKLLGKEKRMLMPRIIK